MKIVLSFPGCHRRAGVERIVFECARFLAGRGHDVTVLAGEWERDETQPVKYQRVPVRSWPRFLRGRSYFENATRQLRGLDFDVLNTHGCVCPLGGVQWVQSVHAAWLERSKSFRAPLSLGRWKQRLNPLHPVLLRLEAMHFRERNYRKIIATTEVVRDDLERIYGVPPGDVVIIPNGFSPSEFNPERRLQMRGEMRAKLGLAPDHIALLFVANELGRKGYGTILEAMRKLGRRDLRLLVVGRASAGQAKREAAAAGLGGQVIVCGSSGDVGQYHAAADLFVLPTQYEAFCLAILEALGSGLPVITTTVPGARDAIQPGINGALIGNPKSGAELAAALEPFLDPVRCAAVSAQVPATVSAYQWPRVLARYEEVLRQHCIR
jgi:UDP-glucose:(heptosyl)LPS alpha-1,3-glucosyltransferase